MTQISLALLVVWEPDPTRPGGQLGNYRFDFPQVQWRHRQSEAAQRELQTLTWLELVRRLVHQPREDVSYFFKILTIFCWKLQIQVCFCMFYPLDFIFFHDKMAKNPKNVYSWSFRLATTLNSSTSFIFRSPPLHY